MSIRTFRLGMVLAAALATAGSAVGKSPVAVREIGHLYVGGQGVQLRNMPARPRLRAPDLPPQTIDPNGDFVAGATYVGFVKLARPAHRYPILMIPGGGLSGASFETTPDGRPGWEWFFLHAGYSVYVADLDQTGRSGWSRYPEIDPDEPAFRSSSFLWETFRIGRPDSYAASGGPQAYPGTQFPVGSFANFARQAQPRFRISPEAEALVFDALVKAVCPCILLTHSAPGKSGMAAAQRWPQLIKAVISVEPSGAPAEAPATALPPHLFVWGDFLDPAETDPSWAEEYQEADAYRQRLTAGNHRADWLSLPARGIRGNSHMLMLDRNSDVVAGLIDRWLHGRGL